MSGNLSSLTGATIQTAAKGASGGGWVNPDKVTNMSPNIKGLNKLPDTSSSTYKTPYHYSAMIKN